MANTCTATTFKARFPEFSSIDDSRIEIFIEDSLLVLNEATWGTIYSLAVCYLTAHYLALGQASSGGDDGTLAPVASQAVDGTSISFNSFSPTSEFSSFYNSTQYGQRFYTLIKSLGVMAATV